MPTTTNPKCDPARSNRRSPVLHNYEVVVEDGVEVYVCTDCGRRVSPRGTK